MGHTEIEGFRLSPHQRQIWLAGQRKQKQILNIQCGLEIRGALDYDRLLLAARYIIGQEEILRTTFRYLPGYALPVQVVLDEPAMHWAMHDLRAYPQGEQQNCVANLYRSERGSLIDLEHGPLVHMTLAVLNTEKHILLITIPTLNADSLTLLTFIEKLVVAYIGNQAPGVGASSEELIQYVQFAEWQNVFLDEAATEDVSPEELARASAGSAFWHTRIRPIKSEFRLAFKESEEDRSSASDLQEISVALPKELWMQAEQIAASNSNTSADVLLLACFAIAVWRLTSQQDLVVALPCNGRILPELTTLAGPCTRSLPLPLHLEKNLRLGELLRNISEGRELNAAWQEYFSGNSEGSTQAGFPERALGFDFITLPSYKQTAGLALRVASWWSPIAHCLLCLTCSIQEEMCLLSFYFDSAYLRHEIVTCLATQVQDLLTEIVEGERKAEAPLASLRGISFETQKDLLLASRGTHIDFEPVNTIHQLIEEQAKKKPDHIAVVSGEEQFSYHGLIQRAGHVKSWLKKVGVQRGDVVALCTEREADLIAGLVGILQAGAAYVPLDPDSPPRRLETLLAEAQIAAVVTQQHLMEAVALSTVPVLCLNTHQEEHVQEEFEQDQQLCPADLAYVIYTSGSTGIQKGVCIEHRQILNYTRALLERLHLADEEASFTFATVSTPAADLGYTAIFAALVSGGCLYMVDRERARDPDVLATAFSLCPVDCLKITPSHLSALLATPRAHECLPLHWLILGGELVRRDLVKQVQEIRPSCVIVNHYGPTEATIGTLTYQVGFIPSYYSLGVPIGLPLANIRVYVLDPALNLVPAGVPGELFLGGAGLARGYLHGPDRTAESFIPNPFGLVAGERLYRTGDIVRRLPDGSVEFLGREDQQIKVHGFRVELAEIEAILLKYPGIHEAVVVTHKKPGGATRLFAYITSATPDIEEATMQSFVAEYLPSYMLPARIIRLSTLPLLPNGKVDRMALSKTEITGTENKGPVALPATPAESVLVDLCKRLLQVGSVSVDDNFFALGGDSILSIELVAHARQCGVNIRPGQVFEEQTIRALAAVAEIVLPEEGVPQGPVTGKVPLVPQQRQLLEQANGQFPAEWDVLLLALAQPLVAETLAAALSYLFAHHDALRLQFVYRSPSGWQQSIVPINNEIPLEIVKVSTVSGHEGEQTFEQALEIAATQICSADKRGPLLRFVLFDHGTLKPAHLLIGWHFLVADAFSMRLIIEDIEVCYRQIESGQSPRLPQKTASFLAWAERLSEHAQTAEVKAELPYWLAEPGAQDDFAPLPSWTRKGAVGKPLSADELITEFEPEVTQEVLEVLASVYHMYADEILLTALAQAITVCRDRPTVLVDVERHGRDQAGLDVVPIRTVGRFTVKFPVPLVLPEADAADPARALKAMKERFQSVPQGGLGYGLLRYCCEEQEVVEAIRRQPMAGIYFNHIGLVDVNVRGGSLFKHIVPINNTLMERIGGFDIQPYYLRIVTRVEAGRLCVRWRYNALSYLGEAMHLLVSEFSAAIRALAEYAKFVRAGAFDASQFVGVQFDQDELEKLITRFGDYHGVEE